MSRRPSPVRPRLSRNAMTVLRRRYLAKTPTGAIIETPSQLFWRVAGDIAKAERKYPAGTRHADFARRCYDLMAGLDFLPNSPTLMNAGRPLQQLSACFVLPVDDSLESIFDAVKYQALIHQSGGGTGFSFSRLRPRADRVATTSGTASGPVSFMRVFNMSTDVIKQGGTRRGANMGILRVDHPDVLDFIALKQQPEAMTNFNLSVGLTDAFMRALKQRRTYALVNPRTGAPVRRISATLVFDTLAQAAWQSGEPGVVFLDTINRANPTPQLGSINATNPCITADTWVQTSDGPRQVQNLIGKPFAAQVNGELHVSGPDGFFRTGTRPVIRLRTEEGYTLRLTADHLIQRVVHQTRYTTTHEWCVAGELKPGDTVRLNNHRSAPLWKGPYTREQGYMLGLLVGDGTLKTDKAVISVWHTAGSGGAGIKQEALRCAYTLPHRRDFKGWIEVPGRSESRMAVNALRELALECGMAPRHKSITPKIEQGSGEFCAGFLRGFFDTDGSVQGTQSNGVSIRLSQTDLPRLQAVQRMLLRLGIASTIYTNRRRAGIRSFPDGKGGRKAYRTQSQHDLVVAGDNLPRFQEVIGFCDSTKAARLTALLGAYQRRLSRARFTASIEAVTADGTEDVFDVQIPTIHAFDANGFVCHNCGEQPLLAYESCTLGSINVARFVTRAHGHTAIDYDRLGTIIPLTVRFLDNVLDRTKFPLPSIAEQTLRTRKIGLGIMGFADLLIQLGIPYDTEEALQTADQLMEFIQSRSHAASARLADERGVFPAYRGSRLQAQRHRRRNATVTTIAPTGTISIIADCSAGIEPLYGISVARTVMEDIRLESLHPEFIRQARARRLPLATLRREVGRAESIQHVNRIPQDLRRLFVTAHDIDPAHHVRMQAVFQRHSDSGVSKTINLPPTARPEDVAKAFVLAHELGCKGLTVFRSGSRDHQVLACSHVQSC